VEGVIKVEQNVKFYPNLYIWHLKEGDREGRGEKGTRWGMEGRDGRGKV
jgi:hypothetical protein